MHLDGVTTEELVRGAGSSVLSHAFGEKLFVSGSFVHTVNQFLSQSFAGSEVNLDVILKYNSSKFL